jgi:hypothetical protein
MKSKAFSFLPKSNLHLLIEKMNFGLQRIGIDLKNDTDNEGQLFFIIFVFVFY